MKKNILKLFLLCLCWFVLCPFSLWEYNGRWADDPMQTLSEIVDENNSTRYAVQRTALDWVSDSEWTYLRAYKISNTLEYFRKNIDPYLQWAVYVWLALATIALIYMWFLMVTNSVTWAGDMSKLKSRIIYVVIWVLLLTGFYAAIKIIIAVFNMVLG